MNANGIVHLVWKEYRAVRGFWLAMIVLVVLLEWLIMATASMDASTIIAIYAFALGAPAFFALGAAGTAFAVEQEEGTFEFLRAAPTSSREIMTSKLLVVILSTLAMYGVFWILAPAREPEPSELRGLVSMWAVTTLEAIAWGTLFSLLSARPLAAVVMGLLAGSVSLHLLVWSVAHPPIQWFVLAPYLAATPRRLIVASLVLAVDIFLGWRWLDGDQPLLSRITRATGRKEIAAYESASTTPLAEIVSARKAADRSTILFRLLWQTVQQSRGLMALVAGAVAYSAMVMGFTPEDSTARIQALIVFPAIALCGSFVFLADQERSRFRFFAEHNVPPRYVWLARHIPWILVLTAASFLGSILIMADRMRTPQSAAMFSLAWGALLFAIAYVPTAYAAGQWCSMMVRSGIMAGFFAVLLNGALAFWCALMIGWQVGWWWSVFPIPWLLMWATWRRAPDWVRENTSWPARLRAARDVLVPTAALLVAVPWYRVHEVPVVSPEFSVDGFLQDTLPEALATGELYKRADDLYEPKGVDNSESLRLVLGASQRPECLLADPRATNVRWRLKHAPELLTLVRADGDRLVREGKLDEAFERYLAALRAAPALRLDFFLNYDRLSFDNSRDLYSPEHQPADVFSVIGDWAGRTGQTPDRLRAAAEQLAALDLDVLGLTTAIKAEYVIVRRYIDGDPSAWDAMFEYEIAPAGRGPKILWPRVMPWEAARALRELDLRTANALGRLTEMRQRFASGIEVASMLPPVPRNFSRQGRSLTAARIVEEYRRRSGNSEWLGSLTPRITSMSDLASASERVLVEFEAKRRGTVLQLELAAFKLEHGHLPESLDAPDVKSRKPLDPYSGDEFRYFPRGMSPPPDDHWGIARPAREPWTGPLEYNVPCVWCTGPALLTVPQRSDDEMKARPRPSDKPVYYVLRTSAGQFEQLPFDVAWSHGFWFPIPEPMK